jgi:hypothetical protein
MYVEDANCLYVGCNVCWLYAEIDYECMLVVRCGRKMWFHAGCMCYHNIMYAWLSQCNVCAICSQKILLIINKIGRLKLC